MKINKCDKATLTTTMEKVAKELSVKELKYRITRACAAALSLAIVNNTTLISFLEAETLEQRQIFNEISEQGFLEIIENLKRITPRMDIGVIDEYVDSLGEAMGLEDTFEDGEILLKKIFEERNIYFKEFLSRNVDC